MELQWLILLAHLLVDLFKNWPVSLVGNLFPSHGLHRIMQNFGSHCLKPVAAVFLLLNFLKRQRCEIIFVVTVFAVLPINSVK